MSIVAERITGRFVESIEELANSTSSVRFVRIRSENSQELLESKSSTSNDCMHAVETDTVAVLFIILT